MTMKNDELSTHLTIPNGPALKRELARAVNYLDVVKDSTGHASDSGDAVEALLGEVIAYMKREGLIATKKAK